MYVYTPDEVGSEVVVIVVVVGGGFGHRLSRNCTLLTGIIADAAPLWLIVLFSMVFQDRRSGSNIKTEWLYLEVSS